MVNPVRSIRLDKEWRVVSDLEHAIPPSRGIDDLNLEPASVGEVVELRLVHERSLRSVDSIIDELLDK